MWHTQWGDKTLEGAEAALFREGLLSLVSCLNQSARHRVPWHTGVHVFDVLTLPAKLAMLQQVGSAMLRDDVPCLELTAVSEGTAAAVFEHIRLQVEDELDYDACTDWRRMIGEACVAAGVSRRMPSTTVASVCRWRDRIEGLMDRIFWDCDWEHATTTLDIDPEVSQVVRDMAGIADDYFTAIAPDPSPKQLRSIRSRLRRLMSSAP
jgi:hypothetical protein